MIKKRKKLQKPSKKDFKKKMEYLDRLNKGWDPLPSRETKTYNLPQTSSKHSNMINASKGYFNKGKYKGIYVKDVPLEYLMWVRENVDLTPTELNLIRKVIKNKSQ